MLTLFVPVGCGVSVPSATPVPTTTPVPAATRVPAAMPLAPHRFHGTVRLADESVAPDGTVVAAIVNGEVVATATVESSFQPGFYLLNVAPPEGESFTGLTVFFTIDGKAAVESAPWRTRESDELNLIGWALP